MALDRLKLLVFGGRVFPSRHYQGLKTMADRDVLDRMKTAGKKIGQIGNHQADRASASPFEHSRRVIGRVAYFGDRLHDFCPGGRLDAIGVVDDPRDGHDSNLGLTATSKIVGRRPPFFALAFFIDQISVLMIPVQIYIGLISSFVTQTRSHHFHRRLTTRACVCRNAALVQVGTGKL